MGQIISIKKAYEMSNVKLPELKKNSGLTDEQIDILYAVASSSSSYHYDMNSLTADYIYSIKISAIKNILKLFNYDGEIYDIEKLLLSIRTNEIYKDFSYDDDVSYFIFSEVYVGETADYDIDRVRTRFIFADDGSMIWKLDENITRFSFEKYDLDSVKKEYKEISDFLERVAD